MTVQYMTLNLYQMVLGTYWSNTFSADRYMCPFSFECVLFSLFMCETDIQISV